MTVNTTSITSGIYTGDNTLDEYSYTFRVDLKTQLKVFETTDLGVETTLTVDVDYTVNNVGTDGGGTITRLAGNLPTNYTWFIRSDYDYDQLATFSSQGGFFPDVHEGAFDKLTFLMQQLLDLDDRNLALSESTDNNFSTTLPTPVADKLFAYAPDALSMVLVDFIDSIYIFQESTPVTDGTYKLWHKTSTGDLYYLKAAAWVVIEDPSVLLALVNTWTETQMWSQGADLPSATTLLFATDGNYFDVTGTTTITQLDVSGAPSSSIQIGTVLKFHFDGILTLTHHATDLILPGGANITTAPGDEVEFINHNFKQWRCTNYTRANGKAVVETGSTDTHKIEQVVNITDGATATTTTLIPRDDTIPQNTEGGEFMTLAITPSDASSDLEIDITVNCGSSVAGVLAAALFQDSTADALAVGSTTIASANGMGQINFKHFMAAGTTSSTTFKVRAGLNNAGTVRFNGVISARTYGGAMSSSVTITEILP